MSISPTLGLRCGSARCASPAEREAAVVPVADVSAVKVPRRSAPQHALAGYNTTRIVMEFMRWAVERSEFPTVEAIVRRFGVSRATAYRWRNSLGETYRLETLPPNEHELIRIGSPGAAARGKNSAGET
ncbi:TPA: hypothetical protein UM344_001245 [Stenotrophomonas maltophilia]|uniref:hypothetical protein n=1 Tax=Stenotrophomonas sp. SMYL28 TaxID=3076049 RepID=UPI002A952F3C|nr:hypothetical protein [Stenotrophomonas sp. SMYL28]HEL3246030.1 hypothetical protein [Stenotrophomonas maltophilia]HEL4248003.1 hypothetical protein [Stenotrophomonas maltophilia]HEL4251643.1 hypothetical protein [Stenotrophomonas maltophilia]HEL7612341.1 hypothetical protein [Stenotrophomonas maltophilia]HEL7760377.1 hypothetical protein [Stenotrophomonas maltophilia]